jgi:phage host-nuclease inhibitor protein Gam
MNIKEYYKGRLLKSMNKNDHPIGRFSSASKGVSDHPTGRFSSASKGVPDIKREIANIERRMSPNGKATSDPYTDKFDSLERRLKELHKQLKSM